MLRYLIAACSLIFIISSCNFLQKEGNQEEANKTLAKVGDEILFYNDLPNDIGKFAGKDSAFIVKSYIDNWVRNKIWLQKATESVSADDPEIRQKITDYTNFLVINKYKDLYMQTISDSITESELVDFYQKESKNFPSSENLYKGTFIKIPNDVPGLKDLKSKILLDSSDVDLMSYCIRYAKKYYINRWFSENVLLNESSLIGIEKKIETKTLLEKSNADFVYLIFITEKVEKGQPAPLDYIKSDLKSLIINKKHLNAIESLENEMYSEGKKSGTIEVF